MHQDGLPEKQTKTNATRETLPHPANQRRVWQLRSVGYIRAERA